MSAVAVCGLSASVRHRLEDCRRTRIGPRERRRVLPRLRRAPRRRSLPSCSSRFSRTPSGARGRDARKLDALAVGRADLMEGVPPENARMQADMRELCEAFGIERVD
jgi:hypothetical protein